MRYLFSLLLFLSVAQFALAQDLLIKNAQIVDPIERRITRGSVVVHNGVIQDVLAEAPAAFSGDVLDAEGKWLIPGLNDMHVHSFGNPAPGNQLDLMGTERAAVVMLYVGVTGFLDLFSPEDAIFSLRDRQRKEGILCADIYAAGPIITCTGGHGTEYGIPTRVVDSPADARREIDDLATKHPDVIKIVYDHAGRLPTMDRATMEAAVMAAREHNIKTVIHIGSWNDAREAVEGGATCITHIYGKEDIPDDLVALMHERKVYEIPTMAVETDLFNMVRDPSLLDRPLLAEATTPAVINAYRDTSKLDPRFKGFLTMTENNATSVPRAVKKLHDGGVVLMTGTDVGNPGTFQGYSLHRELELMVAAGLSTWDALAAATTTPGEFLGQKFGVRVGDVANLLLLDASPIEDISNTQKISAVVYHGRLVNRKELLHPTSKEWTSRLIDDFSGNTLASSSGPVWSINCDTAWGGTSTIAIKHLKGTLNVSGTCASGGGRPGLAGISLMFDDKGNAFNLTRFKGVRLRIKSKSSPLQLKLLTSAVTNYDYHAIAIPGNNELQTLDLPFTQFEQTWSAPVRWTGKDVRGVALWVSSLSGTASYDFTVDSIELY